MFRAIRVLTIAAIIAASLAIGGSTASADTITVTLKPVAPAPAPSLFIRFGITWE
jgi:hypothetical protein